MDTFAGTNEDVVDTLSREHWRTNLDEFAANLSFASHTNTILPMPPKKGAKRPAAGVVVPAPSANPKLSAETEEINAKLSAVDLLVAEMRSQLEGLMEPCMEEMRKEVAFFLMRLPSRVKSMKMSDFLRECGGDVQLLLEKERRAGKCVSWRAFSFLSVSTGKPAGTLVILAWAQPFYPHT